MNTALVVYALFAAIGFTAGAISWAIEPSINSRVQRSNARFALLSPRMAHHAPAGGPENPPEALPRRHMEGDPMTPAGPTFPAISWDNESAPGGAGNTIRGLTHSLDLGKEGLPMNGTRVCSVEGCDRQRHCRDWCEAHYQRWKKRGDVMADVPLRARAGRYGGELCSIDGCDKVARRRGWCPMHYTRWRYDGDPGAPEALSDRGDPTGERRLASRARREGDCLRWTGFRTPTGYGQMSVAGRLVGVHRVAYELAVGPVPEGLEIDHLCRVRDCINPDHLEAVTHAENVRRISDRLVERTST